MVIFFFLKKKTIQRIIKKFDHDCCNALMLVFFLKIYMRSSDIDRTLMSAQAVLNGLYPPNDAQRFRDNLDWQPIPVHTVPLSEDYVSNYYLIESAVGLHFTLP